MFATNGQDHGSGPAAPVRSNDRGQVPLNLCPLRRLKGSVPSSGHRRTCNSVWRRERHSTLIPAKSRDSADSPSATHTFRATYAPRLHTLCEPYSSGIKILRKNTPF